MKKNSKVAAIVVTYNRKALLKKCLLFLLKQSRKPDSIIIIDNCSNDGTNKMIKEKFLHNPIFDYVRLKKNTGSAGGQYAGIKKAYEKEFDWIWCMDDDVTLKRNALSELMLIANNNPSKNFGFLSSRVIGKNGESMNTPAIDKTKGNNLYQTWDELLDQGCVRVKSATFVSFLLNRKAVEKVGLPIKEFFIWCEDTEYSLRITNVMPCYLVGKSVVVHHRKIQKSLNIFKENNQERLKNYFFFFRNSLYTQKKYKGKIFIFYLGEVFWKLIKSFFYPSHLFIRTRILISGFVAFLFFKPKINLVD